MKIKPIVFSVGSAIIISLFFTLSLFWIFYEYAESLNSAKDAINTLGGYFSGIATLWAAIFAAYLFNDWKEQHNKQILAYEAKENFKLIHKERDKIHKLRFTCIDISEGKFKKNTSWYSFSEDFDKNLLVLFNTNKDAMTSFCFLAHGQNIFNLILEYRNEIDKTSKFLSIKKNESHNDSIFITKENVGEVLGMLENIESKNEHVLNELKTYIFVK